MNDLSIAHSLIIAANGRVYIDDIEQNDIVSIAFVANNRGTLAHVTRAMALKSVGLDAVAIEEREPTTP